MEYFICTEIKARCPLCDTEYNIQVKDKKQINIFNIDCKCGAKCKEVDKYGHIKR